MERKLMNRKGGSRGGGERWRELEREKDRKREVLEDDEEERYTKDVESK